MRGATQLLTALLLTALGTGCATGPRVSFDELEDLSRYQNWNFLPGDHSKVEASHQSAEALDALLAKLIEQRLLENGFRRDRDAPDFYIRYELALRQHMVVVNEPDAIYELSSHHSGGSYVFQTSHLQTHSYSEMRLAISAVRIGLGVLWRATLSQDERELHALTLKEAAGMLLVRFPRHDAANAAEERRRRALCDDPAQERARPEDPHEEAMGHQPPDESHPALSCPREAPDRSRKPPRRRTGRHIPA